MSDPIAEAKKEHERMTLADQPLAFTTTCTLTNAQILASAKNPEGIVIPFSQMIDGYDTMKRRLQSVLATNYSLDESSKFPLNFLLMSLDISDIQSPDSNGGIFFAGSLAFPYIKGHSFPHEHVSDSMKFRKIIDFTEPVEFAREAHKFTHPLKHETVVAKYNLINEHTRINPRLVFPDRTVPGKGGVFSPQSAILHGHAITHDTALPDDEQCTVSEVLSAEGGTHGAGVKSRQLVGLHERAYQRRWFQDNPAYDRENGAVVPLEMYSRAVYEFLDNMNSSRSVNFDTAGLWINTRILKEVPLITFKLSFKIYPIVPVHEENKELVPYHNFVKHLRGAMRVTDKPLAKK
jgi:hypothetical protein